MKRTLQEILTIDQERIDRWLGIADPYPFWQATGQKLGRMHFVWRAAILVALAIVVYARITFHSGFIWHDTSTLDRLWSWGTLAQVWTPMFGAFRPLSLTLLWIEHRCAGLVPLPYHCVSLAFHLVNCVLVWIVFRRLDIRGAWLAATLFAIHPVQVQSVGWIRAQSHVIAATFMLLSIWLYLRMQNICPQMPGEYLMWLGTAPDPTDMEPNFSPFPYGFALLLSVAAIAADPVGIVLPFILLLIIWWKRRTVSKVNLIRLSPFLGAALIGIVLGCITYFWTTEERGLEPLLSIPSRIAVAWQAISFYAINLVRLSPRPFVYPRWRLVGEIAYALATLAVLIVGIAAWASRRKNGLGPLILILTFLALILPALVTILNGSASAIYVADHDAYAASAVPLIAIAWVLSRVTASFSTEVKRQIARILMSFVSVGLIAGFAIAQNWVYADGKTIWSTALAHDPANVVARTHYALVLMNEEPGKAIQVLQDAGPQADSDLTILDAAAKVFMSQERYEEAIGRYLIAQRLAPDNLEIKLGLATAYEAAGTQELADGRTLDASERYNCALAICDVALQLDAGNAAIYDRVGKVLASEGRYTESLTQFDKSLLLNPNLVPARIHRAEALFKIGMDGDSEKITEATRSLNEAFLAAPTDFEATFVAATMKLQLSEFPDAEKYFRMAIRRQPTSVKAWTNLGIAQCKQDEFKDALWSFDHALKLRRDCQPAIRGRNFAQANMMSGN